MSIKPILAAAATAAVLLASSAARADLVYNLNNDNCSAPGCGGDGTLFGTVTLSDGTGANAGKLLVTVDLETGYTFHQTVGNAFNAFVYNISGATSGFTTGFAADSTPKDPYDGFGTFLFGVNYSGTPAGADLLTFYITGQTLASLGTNGANIPLSTQEKVAFAVDICVGTTSCSATGPIGSSFAPPNDPAPAVPEVSTWGMMLLGFMGMGFMAYRRRGSGLQFRVV
jgi:hypothetical protein